MKRIIVHLGPPKTGTTTIQAFLYRARSALNASGVRYAAAGRIRTGQTLTVHRPNGIKRMTGPRKAHHLLPWTILGEVDELSADDVWGALRKEITECPEQTIVVSSEAFSRLGRDQVEYVQACLDGFAVSAISYLRNPLSKMLSDYTQRIKSGRYHESFSVFLENERHLIEDYDGFIDHWDAVFGSHSVFIRDFDAAVSGDGLEMDFGSLILPQPASMKRFRSNGRLNVSPGNQTIQIQRNINRLEARIGRPAVLRRSFDAARKLVALRGPAALQRKIGDSAPLNSSEDVAFVESLSAKRYRDLQARCDVRIQKPIFDTESGVCPIS